MQTRRDQLHAYRFQNRRALAALVTGEPNVLEPPMRRLTVTTLAGIMIAILVVGVFALLAVFRPTAGNKWQKAGTVVIENGTGALYVVDEKGRLRQAANYASAVLGAGGTKKVNVVSVDPADIRNVARGQKFGIPDLPASMPSASDLVGLPWTVCSATETDRVNARSSTVVSLRIGSDGGAKPIGSGAGVIVQAARAAASAKQPGDTRYLLQNGERIQIDDDVASFVGAPQGSGIPVGSALLNAIPLGAHLRRPSIAGTGTVSVVLRGTRVGQLVQIQGSTRYAVVLGDGLVELKTRVARGLIESLRIGSQTSLVQTTDAFVGAHPPSTAVQAELDQQLQGLPDDIPTSAAAAVRAGGVCAIFRSATHAPQLAVPSASSEQLSGVTVTQSGTALAGLADRVVLPPGRAAVVRSAGQSPTIFVVADPGRKFPVSKPDVLAEFGYSVSDVVRVPEQLLPLLFKGSDFDTEKVLASHPS